MKVEINDNKAVVEIQQAFNEAFPYLTLEFVKKSSFKERGDSFFTKANCKIIKDYRDSHQAGTITFFPEMTTSDLVAICWESFGLRIQIWRKFGTVWLKTRHTLTWSLAEQNRQGEIISRHITERNKKK